MLSNIGRAAIRRVGAGSSNASTNRVFQGIWHSKRVAATGTPSDAYLCAQFSLPLRRLYATATKTKKAAPAAKKATASKAKPKKAAPKKTVKKAAAKKPTKKKLAVKAKPKPKKVKKVLTEEQKTKLGEKKAREALKALKLTALSPPKGKPNSAWTVLMGEAAASSGGLASKEASAKYKALTPSELEHYNQIANQNKTANAIAIKEWTESHTPEEIRLANNARHLLKRRTGKVLTPLKDDRLPKRARNAYALFVADRWATGDFKGIGILAASPLLLKEFNALSDTDRKVYEDRSKADKQRYLEEFKTVFGRDARIVAKA